MQISLNASRPPSPLSQLDLSGDLEYFSFEPKGSPRASDLDDFLYEFSLYCSKFLIERKASIPELPEGHELLKTGKALSFYLINGLVGSLNILALNTSKPFAQYVSIVSLSLNFLV